MNIPVDVPHREMYWQIAAPYKYLIYPLMAGALLIFAYGAFQKLRFWREGRPDPVRFGSWKERLRLFFWEVPLQAQVLKEAFPGLIHVLIFWSFLALMLATAVVFLDVDFQIPIYHGRFYLLITLLADLAGLALFAGLVIAAVRRYALRPERLDNRWDDAFVLVLLGLAVVTGFLVEGMRIHYTRDPWAAWSPIGYLFSLGLGGMEESTARRVAQSLWWGHFAVTFAFIASIPYTKFAHILTLPVNVFFRSLQPKGALPRVDIEAMLADESAAENFNLGVTAVKDLTWKQRLDYDACIRCGRCQDACPAHLNHHPLSPKRLIADLKDFTWKNRLPIAPANGNGSGEAAPAAEPRPIVGNAFPADAIWECRTCRACMEVCPAGIEHVPQIMELRRGEVMMRGQIPQEAAIALKSMERTGNPFGPQDARSDWIKEVQIPVVGPGDECEALFWIGCCTTYDPVKQKVAYNVLNILLAAGVNVGVLGDDEHCCGDPARALGDENLYQTVVKTQIEMIRSRKFQYLVSHCPHCFNVFRNEYPQFGAEFKVFHHTEVIARLLEQGRLKLDTPIQRKVTFHDPCYLGRYNDIYQEPRRILRSIKGVELVEMQFNRERAHCCGGGGGHYWMDLPTGERLNVTRAKEAFATEARIVAVSCVYCLQMMDDAVKILDLDEKLEVKDISELVVEAMAGEARIQEKEKEAEVIAA
ncbi:MAG: hypothetical protein A2V67_18435 [Deltaproteobacteria bacterium RBG_13_61_14]|nr:MAG: hypothetical protein A2V67_18435 [Deltaproteobacteria bacterium RBG_13_61_14]